MPPHTTLPVTRSPIASKVEAAFSELFADKEMECPPIRMDSPLMGREIGLDSLDFAVLVIRLEEAFGFDPFLSGRVDRFPQTVEDLIALYAETGGNDS